MEGTAGNNSSILFADRSLKQTSNWTLRKSPERVFPGIYEDQNVKKYECLNRVTANNVSVTPAASMFVPIIRKQTNNLACGSRLPALLIGIQL